jgi:hypothetical protein
MEFTMLYLANLIFENWFVVVIALAYAIYVLGDVMEYIREVASKWKAVKLLSNFDSRVSRLPAILKVPGRTLVFLTLIALLILLLPFGIPIKIKVQRMRRERWARRDEERQAEIEASRRIQADREAENDRRSAARTDWLCKNKPKLFYNTINGVTAVLTEKDLSETLRHTELARIDEVWTHPTVLIPSRNTVVFATYPAKNRIGAISGLHGSGYIARYKVAGPASAFHELKQAADVQEDKRIFVPWVKEDILTWAQQEERLDDCHTKGNSWHLVESQAPEEMLPIYQ